MSDDVLVFSTGDSIHVVLYTAHERIAQIGEKMREYAGTAEINGYSWDALLRCWLSCNAPELLEGMDSDPEEAHFEAYYAPSPQNLEKANALAQVINELTADEEEILGFLRACGDEIEWKS